MRDRFVRLDLALALQAFRRELVEPGERDPEWKADDGGNDVRYGAADFSRLAIRRG
jgi:hypothetical protein